MQYRFSMVGLMCLGFAAQAGAQESGPASNSVALERCQTAATTTVRKARPNTDSVKFSNNPQIEEMSQTETEVRDVGEYQDKVARNWRVFAYNCQYNNQASSANVSVTWTQEDEPRREQRAPQPRDCSSLVERCCLLARR